MIMITAITRTKFHPQIHLSSLPLFRGSRRRTTRIKSLSSLIRKDSVCKTGDFFKNGSLLSSFMTKRDLMMMMLPRNFEEEDEVQQQQRVARKRENPWAQPGTFEVGVFGKDGQYTRRFMSKSNLIKETGLNARDLIILDSGYHRRPRPVILVRPTSFVVSFTYIRAIVRHDSVYLFHPHQRKVDNFSAKFGEYLQGKRLPFLRPVYLGGNSGVEESGLFDVEEEETVDFSSPSQNNLPFELLAMEGILSHVCRQLYNRTLLLSPLVKNVLHTLSSRPVDPEILHQLLPMKDILSKFEIETTLMRNVLTELLHNEEDMLHMLLSETRANDGVLPDFERHAVVELLLENYCSQFVDIAQEAYYLRKRVESTQSIMELKLDTYRNHMLKINIQLAMGSMALALGTTMTGYFGANLTSGLENHPTAFFWLGLCSSGAIFGLYTLLKRQVDKSTPRALEGQSIDSIFNHLDEIQQILAIARSRMKLGQRHLSREELSLMLKKIGGVKMDDEDLDIIYNTFDLNKDGQVCTNELAKTIENSRLKDVNDRAKKFYN